MHKSVMRHKQVNLKLSPELLHRLQKILARVKRLSPPGAHATMHSVSLCLLEMGLTVTEQRFAAAADVKR